MTSSMGKVYIVGAGPGDEGLITVKALKAIAEADVVLYDELANSSLLNHCALNAELLYVGKRAGLHALPQKEIENKLVEYAKQGKTVCRLKGGDPLLFGRGGEEMEILKENNIPYEVIPGVTSALASPAYAGIPVTQRGFTSGVAIFTGHEDPNKPESDLNWPAIASLNTTLIFLMGMKNLPAIAQNLIRHGMDPITPVAIIHRGTTPLQKTLVGTLKSIVSIVEEAHLGAPSVIVVGSVVNLRQKLGWLEQKPLFGKKILVTRTRGQASALSNGLRENGAFVCEFPTIEIEPNENAYPVLDKAIKDISGFEWIIFTSANGVKVFFDRFFHLGFDVRALAQIKICAIGPATGDKISQYSLKADLIPEKYIAESIFESLKGKVSGKKILMPRADIARKDLTNLLSNDGALVEDVPVYLTKTPKYSIGEFEEKLGNIDLVTFTSSSTVKNFTELLGNNIDKFRNKLVAASIGPITSDAIQSANIKLACEAKEYTIPGLINAIVEHFERIK